MKCTNISSICGPPPRGASLTQLVRWYRRERAPVKAERLDYYRSLSLRDAVEAAALAKTEDGTMDSHQRRIGKKLCGKAALSLLRHVDEIKACETFEELLECVTWHTRNVERFGPLARYDTAERIGAKLNLHPEKVYLHCGTRAGAKALGLDTTDGILEVGDLPPALRKLPPADIETCCRPSSLARAHQACEKRPREERTMSGRSVQQLRKWQRCSKS